MEPTATSEAGRTQLLSEGYNFRIQWVCSGRRTHANCQLFDSVYAPMLSERTNGQVTIEIAGQDELGLDEERVAELFTRGTLPFATFTPNYLRQEVFLGGLVGTTTDDQALIAAVLASGEEQDRIASEATGGMILFREFLVLDEYFWSKEPLRTPADFEGKRLYTWTPEYADLIERLGGHADLSFVGAAEDVYTAFERGALDGGLIWAGVGVLYGWQEVTPYLTGSLPIAGYRWAVINRDLWERIPSDLQQIVLEVGKEYEADVNEKHKEGRAQFAHPTAVDAGAVYTEFTPELADAIFQAAKDTVLPRWLERVGGPNSEGARIWNEHFAPRLGLRIEPDGSVVEVPVVAE